MKKRNVKLELYYLITNYKWILLAFLIVLSLGIYFIYHALTEKKQILEVFLLDCHADVDGEVIEEDYLDYISGTKTQDVTIRTNLMISDSGSGNFAMTSLASFLTEIGNGKLDVCAMLESDFVKYDASGTWMDLGQMLPEGLLAEWEEYLYYTDDGRAIGIYTEGLPALKYYGCYTSGDPKGVLGILYNTVHLDQALQCIRFFREA